MGMLNGKDSTMTGKTNASWPGDMWKSGGGATWLGGTYDVEIDDARKVARIAVEKVMAVGRGGGDGLVV